VESENVSRRRFCSTTGADGRWLALINSPAQLPISTTLVARTMGRRRPTGGTLPRLRPRVYGVTAASPQLRLSREPRLPGYYVPAPGSLSRPIPSLAPTGGFTPPVPTDAMNELPRDEGARSGTAGKAEDPERSAPSGVRPIRRVCTRCRERIRRWGPSCRVPLRAAATVLAPDGRRGLGTPVKAVSGPLGMAVQGPSSAPRIGPSHGREDDCHTKDR